MAGNKDLPRDPEGPFAWWGSELRAWRAARDWSQEQLAAKTNFAIDTISKLERGLRCPTEEFADACDNALDTCGALARLRIRLIKSSAYREWFRKWIEIEREAQILRTWQPLLIPGLLQTEAYARAIISTQPGITPEQIEEEVSARMGRKSIFGREDPPLLWALVDEGVLHRLIGGPDTMREQLAALLEAAQTTSITVQVVPHDAEAALGLTGAFVLASISGQPDTLYMESVGEGTITDSPTDVRAISVIYNAVHSLALPAPQSLKLITKVMETKWNAQT